MAIRVIEGVPGSGKTFYAVWHLAKNYFKKDKKTGVYTLFQDCTIITNIDGFKPDHVDLSSEIVEAGLLARACLEATRISSTQLATALSAIDPVAEFFSYDYQSEYKKDKPQLVYVIDEAQRYFRKGADRSLKEKGVFDYFEYARHWGQDIYLVTQNVKKLPPDIVHLPEYIISAMPRVRSIGLGFKYHWISSGQVIKREVRRPDKAVFALYKSMDVSEGEKIKNPMLKTIGLAFAGAFLVCFLGYRYFKAKFDAGSADSASVDSVSSPPVPSTGIGSTYIPIGNARPPVEPKPHYIVFVPLNSITRLRNNQVQTLYVWRGALLPASQFPHQTISMAGRRYAVLDYDLFDFMFSNEDDRPQDFIVQVADPDPVEGDGSGADKRNRVKRLERSESSAEAKRTEHG